MTAVRNTAAVGIQRCGSPCATDRFSFAWTYGIDPELSSACSDSTPQTCSSVPWPSRLNAKPETVRNN